MSLQQRIQTYSTPRGPLLFLTDIVQQILWRLHVGSLCGPNWGRRPEIEKWKVWKPSVTHLFEAILSASLFCLFLKRFCQIYLTQKLLLSVIVKAWKIIMTVGFENSCLLVKTWYAWWGDFLSLFDLCHISMVNQEKVNNNNKIKKEKEKKNHSHHCHLLEGKEDEWFYFISPLKLNY